MTRALCLFHVNELMKDTLPLLRTAARIGIRGSFHHSAIVRLRDRLYTFLHNFDPEGSDAYFQEEYEAFVDACACCTLALKRKFNDPMQIVFLKAAVQTLEAVEVSRIGA